MREIVRSVIGLLLLCLSLQALSEDADDQVDATDSERRAFTNDNGFGGPKTIGAQYWKRLQVSQF